MLNDIIRSDKFIVYIAAVCSLCAGYFLRTIGNYMWEWLYLHNISSDGVVDCYLVVVALLAAVIFSIKLISLS